jgi:nucleoside-diphosphate-sugar epimerase
VTQKALALGHDVMVLSRGERPLLDAEGARRLRVDRNQLRAAAPHFEAFDPDVVVDSICFSADQAKDLVALFPEVRRLVLISSVDVYGQDVGGAPVKEERKPEPVSDYARAKLECEQIVLGALSRRATVFRPSHLLGQTFLTASLWGRSPHLVDRIRRGKPIPAIDGGRNLVTPAHAVDVAEWVVRSFDASAADGQIFNAVGGQIVPQRRYYEAVARALGVELSLVSVPSSVFRQVVATPTQFNWHRPYSCEKAARVLGYRPLATIDTMLRETVDYMLKHALVRDCDEHPIDDELVALLEGHARELAALLGRVEGAA